MYCCVLHPIIRVTTFLSFKVALPSLLQIILATIESKNIFVAVNYGSILKYKFVQLIG